MLIDFHRGFWSPLRVWGAPLRFHWTTPLMGLLIGLSSGGFTLFTLLATVMAIGLLLIHELGHAFMVRRYQHHLVSVDVFGFHGACRWGGDASHREVAIVAWGGVLAQGLVLLITFVVLLFVGRDSLFTWTAHEVLIRSNLFLIVLNLLPFPPLDGARAWTLWPEIKARVKARFQRKKKTPARPNLRIVARPLDPDDDPPSEESRRIAEAAIREAIERSKGRNGDSKPTLH